MKFTKPSIFAANHETYHDPPILFAYLALVHKIRLGFVVKQRVLDVSPIWRLCIQRVPHAVVRENNPGGVLEEAANLLRRGFSVIIFPEGTTLGKTEGRLLQGRTGAIRLARMVEGTPIIPVGLLYVGRRRPLKFIRKIVLGDPFYARSFEDYHALRLQTDELMRIIARLSRREYLA